VHESASRSEQGWGNSRRSYSEQAMGRRLFTGDEVRRMRQDTLLMVTGNRPPVQVRKRRWERPPCAGQATALGAAVAWQPLRRTA